MNTPNDANCDDGLWCNGVETCDPATGCVAGTPLDCDDANACTTGDVCVSGECLGEAVTCDDGLDCTVDACDEATDRWAREAPEPPPREPKRPVAARPERPPVEEEAEAEADVLRKKIKRSTLNSPIDGVVVAQAANIGELVALNNAVVAQGSAPVTDDDSGHG